MTFGSRPRRAIVPRAAVAASVVLAAAACSGGDEATPVSTTSTTAATTTTADPANPTADGVLRIGVLVPRTGGQAALGPALAAAGQLAVDDVNEAGGVLGRPVEVVFGDAGDASTDTAGASVDTFAGGKVDVIVGPPSSGVTTLVLDKVARSSAALVSPGNPLADPPADVPYFQLAPDLDLLGAAVGDQAAERGLPTALIVARDDAFGQRVADAVAQRLTARGVTPTIQPYNPESEAYGGDVAAALAAGPAQIVLIGYAELADFIGGFIEQGVLPSAFPMTVVTDRLDQALFRRFAQPGVLNGLVAVGVGSERAALDGELAGRLAAEDPAATSVTFAAEVYDAVVVSALATARAGSDAPRALRAEVGAVTGGEGGEACEAVEACLEAAGRGPVDWQGYGGPYRLDVSGVPEEAGFVAVTMGADNTFAAATLRAFRAER
ncbi:MAG: ABC transporter substrate-binding protein [Acidimicrobiia bacterium]